MSTDRVEELPPEKKKGSSLDETVFLLRYKNGLFFVYEKNGKKCIDNVNTKRYIMNIKISEHAAQRMAERNISEDAVRKAFDAEDWESYDVSEVDESAIILTKTINGKKWSFVFNWETATLITCFPRR